MTSPDVLDALRLLQTGRLREAAIKLKHLREGRPDAPDVLQAAAMVAMQRGDFVTAEDVCAAWVKSMPEHPLPQARLGTAQMHQGRFDDARSTLDQGLKKYADDPHLTRARAELAEREGQPKDAWQRIEPLQQHDDPSIRVEAARVALAAGHAEVAQAIAEVLLAEASVPTIVHRRAAFVRARALETQGDLEKAWDAYVAANKVGARPFDPAAYDDYVNRIIAAYPRPIETDEKPLAEDVVFVVGSPRTGSSLLERIVDAHPEGYGLGEISLGGELLQHIPAQGKQPWFSRSHKLSPADQQKMQSTYLTPLRELSPNVKRRLDKNLTNLSRIGLLGQLFPGAKAVICQREPIPCGLSCFVQDLSPAGFPWSSDPAHIARALRAQSRLCAHWLETKPLTMIDVRYEDFVAGGEAAQRGLIEGIGLEWDPACAKFHSQKGRGTTTSSYAQVQKPMHASANQAGSKWGDRLELFRCP